MSAPNTEAVMAKLFSLAQGVNSTAVPFKFMSRRMRHFKDVGAEIMPAFFQFQAPGRETNQGVRGLPVHRLEVRWIVYLPGSKGLNDAVSPRMNLYYDALSNALLSNSPQGPNGISRNTLGGLVTNCYEDGRGIFDEGLLETQSLIVIPITILTGV